MLEEKNPTALPPSAVTLEKASQLPDTWADHPERKIIQQRLNNRAALVSYPQVPLRWWTVVKLRRPQSASHHRRCSQVQGLGWRLHSLQPANKDRCWQLNIQRQNTFPWHTAAVRGSLSPPLESMQE